MQLSINHLAIYGFRVGGAFLLKIPPYHWQPSAGRHSTKHVTWQTFGPVLINLGNQKLIGHHRASGARAKMILRNGARAAARGAVSSQANSGTTNLGITKSTNTEKVTGLFWRVFTFVALAFGGANAHADSWPRRVPTHADTHSGVKLISYRAHFVSTVYGLQLPKVSHHSFQVRRLHAWPI